MNPRSRYTLITLGACLLIGLLVFLYWLFFLRHQISTDDAYVDGYMSPINAQVAGTVTAFYADNTQLVEAGQLLVEIDATDYRLTYEKEKAALEEIIRQIHELKETVQQKQAALNIAEAHFIKAKQDLSNRLPMSDTAAIPLEMIEHAKTDYAQAKAACQAAYHELLAKKALLGEAPWQEHPLIQAAISRLKQAYIHLYRCRILSPVKGYVAKRKVQLGQWVNPGITLMTVIPLEGLWINANYKETELERIRIKQPTTITTDIYGRRVRYHGIVMGVEGGTGSVFSLLPPQNATGNWIKIVQRVPVRIQLDPQEVEKHPLLLGLSAVVHVDTSDQSGSFEIKEPLIEATMTTAVFEVPLAEVEQVIEDLLGR